MVAVLQSTVAGLAEGAAANHRAWCGACRDLPQTPDQSLSTAEKNGITFPVLSDVGSSTATAFGIAFEVAEELRPMYVQFGHALPDKNGDESWILPIPATYVVHHDGTIALPFLDVDYHNRLEPKDVLTVLRAIRKVNL